MARGIYYFGRNASMMALVGHQLSAAGMEAEGFMDEDQLMEKLRGGDARLLVIGGGVEDEARERLKKTCAEHDVMVLEHSAGPHSLPGSISEALG
jgi:TPP-dependent trihydroxycyclohexane-1,2-dione (THcHDO) dehydratase